jgi:hypothetical protein
VDVRFIYPKHALLTKSGEISGRISLEKMAIYTERDLLVRILWRGKDL